MNIWLYFRLKRECTVCLTSLTSFRPVLSAQTALFSSDWLLDVSGVALPLCAHFFLFIFFSKWARDSFALCSVPENDADWPCKLSPSENGKTKRFIHAALLVVVELNWTSVKWEKEKIGWRVAFAKWWRLICPFWSDKLNVSTVVWSFIQRVYNVHINVDCQHFFTKCCTFKVE